MQHSPVPNALDNTLGGSSDAFVVKIDASDGSVDYGTFLGGSDTDGGQAIDIDDLGNIYVGGSTFSSPRISLLPQALLILP